MVRRTIRASPHAGRDEMLQLLLDRTAPRRICLILNRRFITPSGAVHAVTNHRIECVCDRKDARIQINLFFSKSERVARAVPFLMVLADDARSSLKKPDPVEDALTLLRVSAHHDPLRSGQPCGLTQDRVRHADLSDVVEQCSELKGAHLRFVKAALSAQQQTETDNARRMLVCFSVASLESDMTFSPTEVQS